MKWEDAIIKVFKNNPGIVSLKTIYDEIHKYKTLTAEHLRRDARWSNRLVYTHQIRSHVSNLCDKGILKWVNRGKYELIKQ